LFTHFAGKYIGIFTPKLNHPAAYKKYEQKRLNRNIFLRININQGIKILIFFLNKNIIMEAKVSVFDWRAGFVLKERPIS